jgi:hypothetical protein
MLSTDITVPTSLAGGGTIDSMVAQRVYSLVSAGVSSSTYKVAGRPLDQEQSLTVAHETSKNGVRRNSALIFKDVYADDDGVSYGTVQVTIKLTTDNTVATLTRVKDLVAVATTAITVDGNASGDRFLDDSQPINVDRFLNGEH